MAESNPKGSIFAALRALEEVPEAASPNAPPPQTDLSAPVSGSSPAPGNPSSDLIKGVESRLETIEKKIAELGTVPNLEKLEQMQERAIQAEVALREREKSQEAARRETEALLQNLAAQRRLEESDRQMKENLAYCRKRIEDLEARKPDPPTEVTQEDIARKIEERLRPLSAALSSLEIQNEKSQKALLEIEEKFRNLGNRVDSFFAYQAELTQALIENQKAAAAAQFQAQKTEETLKNSLKQMNEKAESEAEELKQIDSSLSELIPLTKSSPVSETENSSDDLKTLEQDLQKVLSVLDAGFTTPPDK